jgi:hypothetical protein
LLTLATCVLTQSASGQSPSSDASGSPDAMYGEPDETEVLEALQALVADDVADDILADLLSEAAALRANRVDVNSSPLSELLRVPFLSTTSALCISGRATRSPVHSLGELVHAGCLSAEELERVRPYLIAIPRDVPVGDVDYADESDGNRGSVAAEGAGEADRSHLEWSLRVRIGIDEDTDGRDGPGSLERIGSFTRLRVSYGDALTLGVACEKDPGEASPADHVAANAVWKATDLALGLGHFVGLWGQGLVLGRAGFPSVDGFPRVKDRVRGYDGAGETSARRGAFVTAERGRARVQMIAAQTALDATIDERGCASTIRASGVHVTDSEMEGEGVLEELLVGGRVTVSVSGALEVSATALQARYEPGLALGDDERRRYGFSGKEVGLLGADLRIRRGGLVAGAEFGRCSTGGIALVAAARVRRGAARLRAGGGYLARDYWTPVGSGLPGFSSGSNGAVGWVGVEYRTKRRLSISTEARVTGRPWRSYTLELPDRSASLKLCGSIDLGTFGNVTAQTGTRTALAEIGDANVTGESAITRTRLSFRASGANPVTLSVARVSETVDGSLKGSTLAVSARVSGVVGESFSYAAGLSSARSNGSPPAGFYYEPGLPGTFSLRSLNASGARWYIQLHGNIRPLGAVTFRFGGGPESGQLRLGMCIDAGG